MKRHLISQMCNEWRGNLWMIVELVIVSCVLWALFSFLCGLLHVRLRHSGYDMTGIYVADIRAVGKDSPLYQPYDSVHSYRTDRDMLLSGLRGNPYVEEAGMGFNAMPYNYNYMGNFLCENDSVYYYGNLRMVTPEIIRMIRLEGLGGETTEQLAGMIERGDVIISGLDEQTSSVVYTPEYFVGKDLRFSNDSSRVVHVGAVAYGMRRSDYEALTSGVIYMPLSDSNWPDQIIIRVKPGMERQFAESLTAADKQHGNVYLSGMTHIDRMRDVAHIDINVTIRNFVICAVFLLLVIFLGFLGSFWFRTQQRVVEIAMRKVNGATRRDILRRFLGEGMLLLVVATVPAVMIDYAVIHYNLFTFIEDLGNSGTVVYESMAVTFVMLAILIVAGIWFPACKAMNVDPAYALKDQ